MTSHIDEKNFKIVMFDLMLHEYLRSCEDKDLAFVDLVSPYLSNYPIPTRWPIFLSNTISISDIDFLQDFLKLIVSNNIKVRIVTLSPQFLRAGTSLQSSFVQRQIGFTRDLFDLGCTVYFNDRLHAKMTVTSQGVLEGSANITTTGMDTDLQHNTGNYFSRFQSDLYAAKCSYLRSLLEYSRKAHSEDFPKD